MPAHEPPQPITGRWGAGVYRLVVQITLHVQRKAVGRLVATGATPFDKQRLREAAFDEMLRMIREDEPPKPSTRLSTAEGRASIAANRSMEPNKLSGLLRGELDWIVMKALEKDRNPLDIDTRGDIYSLGVLLYELLPYDVWSNSSKCTSL
jgi:hypothetical protein